MAYLIGTVAVMFGGAYLYYLLVAKPSRCTCEHFDRNCKKYCTWKDSMVNHGKD